MQHFQFQASSTRILFGAGVAQQLGDQAVQLGIQHAFLITDPVLAQLAPVRSAVESLIAAGISVELFADVVPDPTDASIEHAAACYRASGAHGLVAVGGGSAMDTAKAVGMLAQAGAERIAPFYFGGSAVPAGLPPLICVPTTAGTGSEVTFVAIVTESGTQRKLLVRHPSIAPHLAIIDPLLTVSLPKSLTLATGMDALAHALEAGTSKLSSPISDLLAFDAIPRIVAALPRVLATPDDLEARSAMSYAALTAGMAFLSGRVHLGHAVGHALGGAYHLPHGLVCIVCMPAILRVLAPHCPTETTRIAALLGANDGDAAAALERLMQTCGTPRLSKLPGAGSASTDELIALVQGEQRLIGLSRYAPTEAEWARMIAESR